MLLSSSASSAATPSWPSGWPTRSVDLSGPTIGCGKAFTPDDLARVYREHPAVVDTAFAETRSEVLGADDPLAAVQQVHWSVRKAFIDYQSAAQARRQLAADTGETIGQFLDELIAAGWSEEQARTANVHELPATTKQPATNRS